MLTTKSFSNHRAGRNVIITSLVARLAQAAKPLALAAAIVGGAAAPTMAAVGLSWDPGQTTPTPSGGTGNWSTTNDWYNGTSLTTWTNSSNATLGGTAGTLTIDSGESSGVTIGTLTVTTDGYIITSSANGRSLTATTLALNASVGLTLNLSSSNGDWAIGSITNGGGSTLTLSGAATSGNSNRIDLTTANTTSSVPITITATGAGISGIVSKAVGVEFDGNISNSSTSSLTMLGATSGNGLIYGGQISGTEGLQFGAGGSGGAGTVTLNAQSSYSGATIFNAAVSGTVKLGIDNALPTTTDVTMGFSSSNGGILDLNGHNQEIASLTNGVGGGSITNGAASGTGTLKISGSSSPAAFTLNITDGANAKTAINRAGTGTLTLGGSANHNTYSGDTTIGGVGGVGGVGGAGTGGIVKAGAASVFSANSTHNIGASGTLDLANFSNSVGLLAGTGLVTNTGTAGTPTLTIADTNALHSQSFGGTIQDGTATHLALTKSGGSTQTFTSANTYTGNTSVTGGFLLANNTSGSATGTSNVTASGGGAFGGSGTISGTLSLNATGAVTPGSAAGLAGTLTTGAETWVNTSSYTFDINNAAGSAGSGWDNLSIGGALDLSALTSGGFTINVAGRTGAGALGVVSNFSNSNPGGYTWALATATSITGTFNAADFTVASTNFANNNPLSGGTFAVGLSGTTLDLIFTPATYTPKNLTWTNGSTDGLWNASSVNWNDPTPTATAFTNTDNVTFDSSQSGTVNVDAGGVTPGSTVVNASTNYTINGGSIGGTGSLTKSGVGTLVLSPTSGNSYSGGTFINQGVLAVNGDAALGNVSGGVTFAGGTLRTDAAFNSSRVFTVNSGGGTIDTNGNDSVLTPSGAIALGANSFTKTGAGDLDVRTNGFSGTGTVYATGGQLTLGDPTTAAASPAAYLGNGTNSLNVNNGAVRVAASSTSSITLASAGNTFAGSSTFTIDQTNATAQSYNVTLGGATSISGTLDVVAAGNVTTAGNSNSRLILGATTLTGDTTFQLEASGASGNVTASTLGLGAVNDNGHMTTFLGRGSGTQLPGSAVNLNTAATSATGAWVIGNSGGTGGEIVGLNRAGSQDQQAMTSGDITVNPYGQLQFTNGTTSAFGSGSQTITLHGIGAELADLSAGTVGALLYNPASPNNNTVTFLGNMTIASDGAAVSITGNSGNNNFVVGGTGTFTGTLQKNGSGELRFAGTDSGSGATLVTNGKLTTVNAASNLGTGDLTLHQSTGNNTAVSLGNTAQSIGNLQTIWTDTSGTRSQKITLTGTVLTVNETGSTSFGDGAVSTLTGVIVGTGSLIKQGGGTLTLAGTNTYTGGTFVNGGTLALTGTGSLAGNVTVGASGTFDVSGLNTPYTLGASQTLSGKGTITGNIAFTAGATLSPGASPGILTETGNQTWTGADNYNWQVLDATGAAGVGFDQMAITGSLDVSAAAGFDINLWSLSSITPDTNGDAADWNNTVPQSWVIASASTGIIGFNPSNFNILVTTNDGTGGFSNALGGGSFSLSVVNGTEEGSQDLVLSFNPVATPEPTSLALLALGGMFIAGRRRDSQRV